MAISPSVIDGPDGWSLRTTLPSTMSSASGGACISSAAMSSAFARTFSAPLWVADAVITVAREACAPMPYSMRSVWPWMTRTLPVVDAERVGADLRHHGLEALAERGAAGDHLDHAGGVDLDAHAVGGPEPALLDEHRKTGADQLAGGAAAREVGLELVPAERRQHLVEQPG